MLSATLGCGGAPSEDLADVQSNLLAANGLAANGLAANGLAANGLAANGLAANGLAANGLAANGLAANGLAANGLADPAAQKFMEYVVSCALPPGHSVTYTSAGVDYTFAGGIGVAPDWEQQSCDGSCQRWVSACVLARLNKLGVHRQISIRGANDALAITAHELQDFPVREASYYGNLFQVAQPRYACLPPKATEITRVCGDSLVGCAVAIAGACEQVCETPGRNGTYRDCAAQEIPAHDGYRGTSNDDAYAETVTVFLAP
ncbi:MAG TPA: hypothetical protein VFH68_17690 [Polyangia bacterium]|nr:hypothetical protein [Polyangia bacterium]